MAEITPITRQFPNGGLQLRTDAALLDVAHYSELTNIVSLQEGALAVRLGNQKITALTSFSGATAIHSITSLRIGDQGAETLYVGEGGNIWSSTSGGVAWVEVATGCAPTVSAGAYPRQSFSAASYGAGSSGIPYEYFACPSKMLKDNGSFASLQNWGIIQPSRPAVASLSNIVILPANSDVVVTPGGGSLYGIGTIASFTGTGPGNVVITPSGSSISLIRVGQLLEIGAAPQYAAVLSVTSTKFTVYLATTPTVGDLIQNGILISFATGTNVVLSFAPVTIDASFAGVPSNGYSTDDPVHLGLSFLNLINYTAVTFRVLVHSSTTDYYEKVIIDPNNFAGSVSKFNLKDLAWNELSIPKSSFTAVGNAGTPTYSWKQVTGFQVIYTTAVGGQIDVGSIYISGGFGPSTNSTNSTAVLTPYKYVYTYRNPVTGSESNPSVLMIDGNAVNPQNQTVAITLIGTGDPQIAGASSIAVYRAGGAFADGLYRLVGYAVNPGAGSMVVFYDKQSDASILVANTADFDNDPPVPSSLPTPLIMTSNTPLAAGASGAVTVTVTSGLLTSLTVGSVATIALNTSVQESAVISAINVAGNTVTIYVQYDHSDAGTFPFTIQVNTVANKSANLCLSAFDSMFVAGDKNNPHVLYKSKSARPEAFPVIIFATGVANAINVGTPSNYIVNITEYNGGVLCLNLNNLFYVRVASGIMEAPIATPAQRGLLAKNAWCQADNDIWYLSYDGIYSWSGGASQWRTADLDPLFKGLASGPYQPVDLRPNLGSAGADIISMAFSENEVFISYRDVLGKPFRMRYHTVFQRWSIEQHTDATIAPALCMVTSQFNDKTTGLLYVAKNPNNVAHLYIDNQGTSDGWVVSVNNGGAIPYAFIPQSLTLGAPNMNKTFADVALEYNGPTDSTFLDCFYDYANTLDHTAAGDTFLFPATSKRGRAVMSLQGGYQKEAYAMQTRFYGSTSSIRRFYSMTVNVVPLTQIQVGRAYDWDELGHPYDKRLYQLVMEYDIPVGQAVVMNMDTMTGVIGVQQENTAVQSFTLSPPTTTTIGTPNRITANFALADNMIVKKVRLRPSVTTIPFKHFSYSFPELSKYPADTTRFTEWTDLGYPGEKVLRTLNLEMNSAGLPCVVQIQGDSGNLGPPITVTTTLNDRARILTLVSDLSSQNTRLVLTPSAGGYSQYFKHSFDMWREPLAVTHFDSYEFNFGYNGFNFVKQAWLEYKCAVPITLVLYIDNGQSFYAITLPAHPQRDIERFYLPDSQFVSGLTVLNKSKRKRFTVDSAVGSPFKIYADGSRFEWMACGSDQRSTYQQTILTEVMSPQIGVGQ